MERFGTGLDTAVFAGSRADHTVTDLGAGRFRIVGPDGTDTLQNVDFARFADQTIALGPTGIILTGDSGANALTGTAGDDTLNGLGGDDTLTGDQGDDVGDGGDGDDLIVGGHGGGDDSYRGGGGQDTVRYASAVSPVSVDLSAGTASGTDIGHDSLSGVENVIGGSGSDTIRGDGSANVLNGLGGSDVLIGGGGADVFVASQGGGADVISDFIVGTDQIDARAFGSITSMIQVDKDTLVTFGDGSTMRLTGVQANTVNGGSFLFGAPPPSPGQPSPPQTFILMSGAQGADSIVGSVSGDAVSGQAGADTLSGGLGNDWLYGGVGNDRLIGGTGADVFVAGPAGGTDTVSDFKIAEGDRIDLSVFGGYVSLTQVGADTKVLLSDGGALLLKNIIATNLTSAQFIGLSAPMPMEGAKAQASLPLARVNGPTSPAPSDLVLETPHGDLLRGLRDHSLPHDWMWS